jgi:hypothetical protein
MSRRQSYADAGTSQRQSFDRKTAHRLAREIVFVRPVRPAILIEGQLDAGASNALLGHGQDRPTALPSRR